MNSRQIARRRQSSMESEVIAYVAIVAVVFAAVMFATNIDAFRAWL